MFSVFTFAKEEEVMVEPARSPIRTSGVIRILRAMGVEIPAEIIGASTVAIVWHLVSGKGVPPKGDVRVAIAKIVVPDLVTTGNAERQAGARARHEAALTKITAALAFINQQEEETIRDMNAARSTEDWTAIFTNIPLNQWVEYVPQPGSVPRSTWQKVSKEVGGAKTKVTSFVGGIDEKLPKTAKVIHESAEKRRLKEQEREAARQNPKATAQVVKDWIIGEHNKRRED